MSVEMLSSQMESDKTRVATGAAIGQGVSNSFEGNANL